MCGFHLLNWDTFMISKAIKEVTVNGVLYATGVALVLTLPIISAIVWIVNEE